MIAPLAICIGASLGALARWRLGLWLSPGGLIPGAPWWPTSSGVTSLVCVAVFQALPQLDPAWRLALVTGFLGALTTFSSFSAEVVGMLQAAALPAGPGHRRCSLAGLTAAHHRRAAQRYILIA